ncbi:flagellar assembly protein FliH [Candidatus Gastranaerophilus sp. (ex Termes propinquus)]|nr:flagellar assembly protein FliH [Candidatus Gastranaerophilus sp. (ex Termes propinquus)]
MSKINLEKIDYKGSVVIKIPEKQDEETPVAGSEFALEARNIIENAQKEAQAAAQKILEEAQTAKECALSEAQNQLVQAQSEAEAIRELAREEGLQAGFQKGVEDGRAEVLKELQEKISAVDFFASKNFEIKQKILKSAQKEAIELCIAICHRVCHKVLDKGAVEKILEQAFLLLECKEQVSVIVSPYISEMLGDVSGVFENIQIVENSKLAKDTIIVESLSDRLDCSLTSQLNEIANAFNGAAFECTPDEDGSLSD